MRMQALDLSIIFLYLGAIVGIGFAARRRARTTKRAYLLGDNRLPWPLLGLSNAASMFDISGTVWLVTILVVYGLKSIWLPWLWPIFNQIFLMVFLSAWIRRSGVTTGAEWLRTRFGEGRDAERSQLIMVVFALIMGIGSLTYAFIGLGKFVEVFLPWEAVRPYVPFEIPPYYVAHFYGLVFTLAATLYTVLGGMVSIVWADLLQFAIMATGALVIGITAMQMLATQSLPVPSGWHSAAFGWRLELDWEESLAAIRQRLVTDGFEPFGFFFTMMLCKGVLASLAGPAPTSDLQKILSARNAREAALMSGSVSLILMPLRYFMVAGFAVMGLLYFSDLDLSVAGRLDLEQVMPAVLGRFFPVGVLGLLLAGFLAAFVSSFAATLNAAQAYLVNDLYVRYLHPAAGPREITRIAWISGLLLAATSIFFGFFAKNVNDVVQWIVSGLYGSYLAANLLKWYWWRFNGAGYFWGMVGGLIPALTFRQIFDGVLDLYTFPLLFGISLLGCILGTFSAPPVDSAVLERFYRTVRPWGWWGPVRAAVLASDEPMRPGIPVGRTLFNLILGIAWQTTLIAFPIVLIVGSPSHAWLLGGGIVVITAVLWQTWYRKLEAD